MSKEMNDRPVRDASRRPAGARDEASPADRAAVSRRDLLSRLGLVAGAVGVAALAAPAIEFLLRPVLYRPAQVWRSLGPADKFVSGQTVEVTFENAGALPWSGPTGRTGAWLRRDSSGGFTAFALNCTHLGCPVRWDASARLFFCACHAGTFYADGRVAGGPPRRPLVQYQVRVRNGEVEIRTAPLPIV